MTKFWTEKKGIAEIVGAALLILFLAIQIMPAVRNVSINSDKLIAAVDTKIKGQLTSGNNYSIPVHGTDFTLMEDTQTDFSSGTLINVIATSTGELKLPTANNLTFSRNSTAYKLDGASVSTNQPRYETGKFGSALMIENGTTNLLTTNQSSAETDTSGFSSCWDTPISRDTSRAFVGTASIKVDTTSRANDGHGAHGVIINPISTAYSAGTYFVASAYVWAPSGVTFTISSRILDSNGNYLTEGTGARSYTGNNSWQKVYTDPFTVTGQSFRPGFQITVSGSVATTFWVDALQLEQGRYASTWVPGGTSRSSESVSTALADIINTKEGTIEFWLKPLYLERNMYVGIGGSRFISASEDNSSYNIWYDFSDGGLHTSYGYGTGLYITGSYNGLQTGNWYYIATTWKENDSIKLYVNGTLHSTTPIGTLGTSSVFKYQTLFLGQSSLAGFLANALFDELRISNKARNADEISSAYSVGSALSIDEYTTYKCSFDGTLLAGRGGMRISPVYDISQVKIASGSSISWTATTPSGTGVAIESNLSLDGGSTWLGWKQCTNGGQIPDIAPGMDLSNARLQIREKLTTSDVTVTPSLDSLTINITAQ